ncbi:hypothetical protein IAU60_005942 [Kwoniella sp. DSM 27419]
MPSPESLPGLSDDYTSQYFRGDVVSSRTDPTFRGKVLRCWADEDGELPPLPPGTQAHPLDRLLKRGEVGISNMRDDTLAIVPESTLTLRSREFQKGDVVKRSLTSSESAVVTNITTEVKLQHAISKEAVAGWVDYALLENSLKVEAKDRVVYGGWLGTIEEVFEDGLIESKSGICYRFAEMGGLLEPGRVASDVVPPEHDFHLVNPFPPFADPTVDRVIEVRPVVIYITWNALNQTIPASEQHKYPEPKQFWYGKEVEDLVLFPSFHLHPAQVGSSVLFSHPEDEKRFGVKPTQHAGGDVSFTTLVITESRTRLSLLWQKGQMTEEMASDLVPYRNIDDYEAWPGEHVVWHGDEGERRPAVLQTFDPHQRVAELYFPDTNDKQIVPALELDPGGRGAVANFGVGRGQQVLLCEKNGSVVPEVPQLGQTETPVKNMWSRNELARYAEEYIAEPGKFGHYLPRGEQRGIDWWGEVDELHLDGTLTVSLAGGGTKRVSLEQVYLLNDPFGEVYEDVMSPEMEDQMVIDELGDMVKVEMGQRRGSDASWETMEGEEGDELVDEDMDVSESGVAEADKREGGDKGVLEEAEDGPSDMDAEMRSDIKDEAQIDQMIGSHEGAGSAVKDREQRSWDASTLGLIPEAGPSTIRSNGHHSTAKPTLEDDENWQQFEMLEEAPMDHHFITESPLESANKAYLSRLKKEHKALLTSLPENILVRTYENRTDLMRVLIVGPEGTPYADAPFVFDVYLNPTKFPNDPPLVHFHSHTNGNGRCNPNLYEDGKVCLSILGTWSGDASESWNPVRSSLLQVFVSISGLVLVRSPYHCEPAFAKLEGTKEGRVNSRLYSEKAYVLSRSFVRTALERPPTGLADEIRYLYLTKGRLRSVLEHASRLIEKTESQAESQAQAAMEEEGAEMWNADAIGSLTMGSVIKLKRTVAALQRIEEKECT